MAHPILEGTHAIGQALKSVADVNPVFMTTDDKAEALVEISRLEARLAELRLRIMADAADVAATDGSRDIADWLAGHTRIRFEDARADYRLAAALDRRYAALAVALRHGQANLAQAQVITRRLDDLPTDLPTQTREQAEHTLVGYAAEFTPRQLGRLGRRVLDVIAPDIAEAAEARRLAALEANAIRCTRLTLRRVGDGTTRITGLLPDAVATRLAIYLEAFTNPRKTTQTTESTGEATEESDPEQPGPDRGPANRGPGWPDPVDRLPYPRRLGQAFCHLLEAYDPARLPLHAGDATTLIVTVGLDTLRRTLGTADLLSLAHIPGEDSTVDDATGETITADQARRLACTATIIPAVLGSNSQILDLGRSVRLFTHPQRKALLLRDRTCRAEGCTIPGTWAEAHHLQPWSEGGPTTLANGILLCRHHHQRIHDPRYHHERLPGGDIRFYLRT
ncbi:MAG: DUF222 domain-containing protein [Nocardioides sp.]|uniref:HNH endonuclease signature motif containing protein n=1 Tax=Nocardioides sp. TaxID=35761 RepID=UPI0039E3D448